MKVIITILCRNAEKTLEKTYLEIPKEYRKHVLLSDDNSTDSTIDIAKRLKIKVYKNPHKGGYGSNAKNCFNSAIKEGADVLVILHSDNQYDATKIPALVKPIEEGKADFTTGTRMVYGNAKKVMPTYRYYGNKCLTLIENIVLDTGITDLHSGLIAVRTSLLKRIPFDKNYDDYSFHSEIIVQSSLAGANFAEVRIPTRYDDESQSTNLPHTILYGLRTLKILMRYITHRSGIKRFPSFEIKRDRPTEIHKGV